MPSYGLQQEGILKILGITNKGNVNYYPLVHFEISVNYSTTSITFTAKSSNVTSVSINTNESFT